MVPDFKSDLGVLGNRSSLIMSSISIVDWNGHDGGMSQDLVLLTKARLMALLVHPLSTNAVVAILVSFPRILIWTLMVKSLPFLLSMLMYCLGCRSSSSHQSASTHIAFRIPSIMSSTTSSARTL